MEPDELLREAGIELPSTGLASLLDEVERFIKRFVVFADAHQARCVTLWIAHTHAFEAADTTLYLEIASAAPESGKSRLFEVLELLVAGPFMVTDPSASAIFRTIDEGHCSLLLDEIDTLFAGDRKEKAALIGLLNGGYRRGLTVPRVEGDGRNRRVHRFKVFAPKAFAGLGRKLPPATQTRSALIRLKRKKAGEQAERFRIRQVKDEAEAIRARLQTWAQGSVAHLADAWPELPDELSDRQMDAWEPLFAIADLAGGAWRKQAREAAVALHHREQSEAVGLRLLADIEGILATRERIHSGDLAAALNELEESLWGGWNDGKGIRQFEIAKHLTDFEVGPKLLKIDGVPRKGYDRAWFADAFERYLRRVEDPELTLGDRIDVYPFTPQVDGLIGAEAGNGDMASDLHGKWVNAKPSLEGLTRYPEGDGSPAETDDVRAFIRSERAKGSADSTVAALLNTANSPAPPGFARWTGYAVRTVLGQAQGLA